VKYEHEIEIERAPEDVYAFISNPENLPKWQEDVLDVRRESDTEFTEVRTFVGRRVESTIEVTKAEPGREFAIRAGAGPVRFAVRHLLEPAGEGRTKLRILAESDSPGGVLKLGGRLLRGTVERRARADFERLKELLESHGE
jgi:carbon monoxide dehydrogenase subunit G